MIASKGKKMCKVIQNIKLPLNEIKFIKKFKESISLIEVDSKKDKFRD
jgi:hypothetical protein